ncbi:MAG: hypothetical protein ACRCXQ_05710 [Vagococcus fluvialis]
MLHKNVKVIFVNRSGEEYQYQLCERKARDGDNPCDLSLDDAILTSEFIKEQANFFDAELITLEPNEYIRDVMTKLIIL